MGKNNLSLKTVAKYTVNTSNGFTIMELMITLFIMAALSSIAVPSFANIVHNGRIRAASLQLLTTLANSRYHALSFGVTVIVCQAKDSTMKHCSDARKRNTRWSDGVISYADLNGNNLLDEKDLILTTAQSHKSIVMVFNQNGRLRFLPNGSSRSAGFYLCSKAGNSERHLKILYTGRTRSIAKMSDHNRQTCLSKAN